MTLLLALLSNARAGPDAPTPATGGPASASDGVPRTWEPVAARVPWALPETLPEPDATRPTRWWEVPVAASPHPVAFHYGRRYQEFCESLIGGPRASPVFGPTVAEADVHWRLLDATGRGLDLPPEAAPRWRDTAVAGSFLAIEHLVDETFERAPILDWVYVAGDTILSPSFDLRASEEPAGPVEVRHHEGGAAARAVERAEEELALGRDRRPMRGPPPASVGLGMDWELRDTDAPPDAPLVAYTAWLTASELLLSSLRLEYVPWSRGWGAYAKRALWPRVALVGSARSVTAPTEVGIAAPGRLSGGVQWTPPLRGSCSVRAERILQLDAPDARWMLGLRCENRTAVPARLDPPLGDRGRGGPTLPWVPERRPNTLTAWGATSASGAPR